MLVDNPGDHSSDEIALSIFNTVQSAIVAK